MDFPQFFDLLRQEGAIIALLLAIIATGARKWWVFGHHYEEKCREVDQWRSLLLSGHEISKTAVSTLRTVVEDQRR